MLRLAPQTVFSYSISEPEVPKAPLLFPVSREGMRDPLRYAQIIAEQVLDCSSAGVGQFSLQIDPEIGALMFLDGGFQEFAEDLHMLMPEWFYYFELESPSLLTMTLAALPVVEVHECENFTDLFTAGVSTEAFEAFFKEQSEAARIFFDSDEAWLSRMLEVRAYFDSRLSGHSRAIDPKSPEVAEVMPLWTEVAKEIGLTDKEKASELWVLLDERLHIMIQRDSGELLVSHIGDDDETGSQCWVIGFCSEEAAVEWDSALKH